jgi:hypothetical protein
MKHFIVVYWIGTDIYPKFRNIQAETPEEADLATKRDLESRAGRGRWHYTIGEVVQDWTVHNTRSGA